MELILGKLVLIVDFAYYAFSNKACRNLHSMQILTNRYDLGRSFREFYFETRGGARVPYAIESNDFRLGIIPIVGDLPNRIEKSAAASFLKKYNQSRALFLTHGKTAAVIDEKSIVAPCYWFI